MTADLSDKRIAFLATDGVEESELSRPWEAVKSAGAEPVLVSIRSGDIQAIKHSEKTQKFPVDQLVAEVKAEDFDGLVLPGGVANPDALRVDSDAVNFVKDFFDQGKPVAAICHGPWTLVEADVLKGRTLTSWPSLKTDIINAGGDWVDEEVHVDNGLVTSRKPDDLDAFCAKAIEEFGEGFHARQAAGTVGKNADIGQGRIM